MPQSAMIGLSQAEVKRYSFNRAINALLNPTNKQIQEAAAFEKECHEAANQKRVLPAQGMAIPEDILTSPLRRDLTVGTAADGGNLVGTDLQSGSFIEMLNNNMVCKASGAKTLPGLVGDVAIPAQSGGATAYWVAESGAPTEGQASFTQVSMTPKTVGAFTDISRKLLKQSAPAVDGIVPQDLARSLAIEIDLKALYGDGTGNTPTGIVNTNGINTPTNFAAAVPTWAEMLTMMGAVETDNALLGALGYVTDAGTKAALMATSKDAGSGQFVWSENNTVAGYRALASSQITSGDVFFGNWGDLIIGMWGGLDLTIDPYSSSSSGTVRVVAFQDVDIAVRHAVSFAYNNDGA